MTDFIEDCLSELTVLLCSYLVYIYELDLCLLSSGLACKRTQWDFLVKQSLNNWLKTEDEVVCLLSNTWTFHSSCCLFYFYPLMKSTSHLETLTSCLSSYWLTDLRLLTNESAAGPFSDIYQTKKVLWPALLSCIMGDVGSTAWTILHTKSQIFQLLLLYFDLYFFESVPPSLQTLCKHH